MELIISIVAFVISILVLITFFSIHNNVAYLTKVAKHKMERDEEIIRLLKKMAGEQRGNNLTYEDKAKLYDSHK